MQTLPQDDVTLVTFSRWLSERAMAASWVCAPTTVQPAPAKGKRKELTLTTVVEATEKSAVRSCVFCDSSNHDITDCKEFLKKSVADRSKWVIRKRRCLMCFSLGHVCRDCPSKRACGVSGCSGFHHKILHRTMTSSSSKAQSSEKSKSSKPENSVAEDISMHISSAVQQVMLRMVPVVLKGPLGEVSVRALLDDGSTVSMIDGNLAAKLGLRGPTDPLSLKWVNAVTQKDENSQRVSLHIRGVSSDQWYEMSGVRTKHNLSLPAQTVDVRCVADAWPHLSDVQFPTHGEEAPVLLIGQDQVDLTVAREVCEGPRNAPLATRTKLGWVLQGNVTLPRFRACVDTDFVFTAWTETENDALHQLVKDSFSLENFGVKLLGSQLKSEELNRAENLLDQTTRRVGERYETGLLWKAEVPELPASKDMALRRLLQIERKMTRQPELAEQYHRKIEDYVKKGYACKLTPEEAALEPPHTWYLPHFSVVNVNKPGKLRLVFDAAAKAGGKSLNDALLPGPDLLNSLVAVLMKFREG